MTDVLVCVKRVPETAAQVSLTVDGAIDTSHAGFTLSSHDECAVTLAVDIANATGGEAVALSLGTRDAEEQIRGAIAVGCGRGVLIEAEPGDFGPVDVANAIAAYVRTEEGQDRAPVLILVGNDAADTGDFQVGVRLAHALGRPVLTGISTMEVTGDTALARGTGADGTEVFELPLPAVVAVREGGVEPRYPSVPGRMKAKRAQVDRVAPGVEPRGSGRVRLKELPAQPSEVQVLGEGAAAVPALVDVLEKIGVVR
jgi:electron transfer flavoprotein beta subunit